MTTLIKSIDNQMKSVAFNPPAVNQTLSRSAMTNECYLSFMDVDNVMTIKTSDNSKRFQKSRKLPFRKILNTELLFLALMFKFHTKIQYRIYFSKNQLDSILILTIN